MVISAWSKNLSIFSLSEWKNKSKHEQQSQNQSQQSLLHFSKTKPIIIIAIAIAIRNNANKKSYLIKPIANPRKINTIYVKQYWINNSFVVNEKIINIVSGNTNV